MLVNYKTLFALTC